MQSGVFCEVEYSQLSFPPSASPLAHARSVAVQALGLEIVEVILKTPLGVHTEIVQERPGVDAGRVHIVETEPHRIIADRINGENRHVALSANRFALRFGMTLHFGGGAGDAEQFRGETESLAVVKCDVQRPAVFCEPDFNRPRRRVIRHARHASQYQPGPTKLLPGSPTLAPLVVNATELGCWM